jgi:hypothetical protein
VSHSGIGIEPHIFCRFINEPIDNGIQKILKIKNKKKGHEQMLSIDLHILYSQHMKLYRILSILLDLVNHAFFLFQE